MATEDQEFSFPTTTDTPPRFPESPRLWRTTSLVLSPPHETTKRDDEDGEDVKFLYYYTSNDHKNPPKSVYQRKSFSHIECGMKSTRRHQDHDICPSDRDEEDDEKEKMDVLWEDFNEEFSRNSNSSSPERDRRRLSSMKVMNFGCVQHSLKLSRPSKKPSLVEFVKVLKKMFLLQNSHRSSIKKTQR